MPSNQNNQRIGSKSNAHVGNEFENIALRLLLKEGLILQKNYKIQLGLEIKKEHGFDLGNDSTLVECKSHTWTNGHNVPSAKLTVWNEAMYYFHLAPAKYKKIFFVLMDYDQKKTRTLLQYYIDNYYHFIPHDVIFYEYYQETDHCDKYTFNDILNKLQADGKVMK